MEEGGRITAFQADDGRYRLLVDAITDYAVYMLDRDGFVSSWNPGAQRFKGYEAAEILGRHFSHFYTEEDRAAGLPELALRTAREEGRFEREGWRVRKDGGRFWAHVVIDPIRDAEGGILGFAKITRDLTERRAAEEALRRSEQQFSLLVQGVADYALYMLDLEGRVSSWNPGAQRIKGYRPDEIIGRHFSVFYTEEDRAAGLPARGLETALREGRWEREGLRVRKDGGRFWAHVIIDPIRNEQGQVIGFAKITRDVTERKEAEQALEEAREALFQSQKLEAIGRLTGGVAHDFNNLLMAVLGSLELVRKRLPYDPRITPLVENAIQGAERGANLTRRMLSFARRQELCIGPVDLADLVWDMLGLLQRSIGPQVRIDLRMPPSLPWGRTDPVQLENALVNLVVNARDAMPAGGVITISAVPETLSRAEGAMEAGDYVRLTVSDTGEGMDEATVARAAEPFFTTKGPGKGTGLGLSMVHGLAAQSGGRLLIRSRAGKGTSVDLWLPAAAPGERAASSEAPPDTAAHDCAHLKILAVDDDILVLMNTVALLEDIGHEVLQARSAQEALDLLAHRTDVDLVITDQAMPGMSGLQLREEVRRARPKLPVLIATGYAEMPPDADPDVQRISKPFTQGQLAAGVQRALATHPGRALARA